MLFQSGCERCLAARGETGCCPNNFASSSSSFQPSGNGQPTPAASARSRYSWTVLSPIRQLRAICRCPNLNSNRNRRTSLTFRMDDLLAGTLFSLCMEFSMPRYCPALLRPSSVHLWKTFRSKPNTIPVDEQNCSPSHRNGVRLQTGMLFGFTTEWCSPSDRNRVRLRPDSPNWFTSAGMIFLVSLDKLVGLLDSRRLAVYNLRIVIAHMKRIESIVNVALLESRHSLVSQTNL